MDKSLNIIGRRIPIRRTHRKIIVVSVVYRKLFFEVIKRVKSVSSIKDSLFS